MEPIKTYDYLTRARQQVFGWVRPLSAEQYAHEFPIGLGTLAKTLTHIMISEWYYVQRMQSGAVPPYDQWPIQQESLLPFSALEAAWMEQAQRTRNTVNAVRDWSRELEYEVTDDDNRQALVTASPADIFTQLTLHEVHHRAQAMAMLRQLGVSLTDLDFNTLMYKRRSV